MTTRRGWAARQASAAPVRGYANLYHDHVLAADRGCDFDFLTVPAGKTPSA